MIHPLTVTTNGHNDVINLTDRVASVVTDTGVVDGICTVFVPHSTCAVTTIEYEEGLVDDIDTILKELIPSDRAWQHNEKWGDGNGHAHLRAAIMGPSLVVPVVDGGLQLGTWQQIVLIDFDNRARERTVQVQVVSSA